MVTAPDDFTLRELLHRARRVALVGLSADPARPSHQVAAYLLAHGITVLPVNPRGGEVLGQRVHPDLAAVPGPIDLVDVFRPAEACPEIARAAVAAGAKVLWLQLGIVSEEAAAIARAGGLAVVMDRCTKIEHARLVGARDLSG